MMEFWVLGRIFLSVVTIRVRFRVRVRFWVWGRSSECGYLSAITAKAL